MSTWKRTSVAAWFSVFGIVVSIARTARTQDADACIDASEQALGLRKAEKLFAARARLSTCAAADCPDIVRASCKKRLAQVTEAIPSIAFVTKDGSGNDVAAVRLTIDGVVFADRLVGDAIELDPGEHEFTFEVADEPIVHTRFVLRPGEKNRHETIVIGLPPPRPVASDSSAPPADSEERALRRKLRMSGILVGSAGVAALIEGAITGELAISKANASRQNCPFDGTMVRCDATGVSEMGQAKAFAVASDIGFGVGAAGLVTGTVLLLLKPHADGHMMVPGGTANAAASWNWNLATTPHGTYGTIGYDF